MRRLILSFWGTTLVFLCTTTAAYCEPIQASGLFAAPAIQNMDWAPMLPKKTLMHSQGDELLIQIPDFQLMLEQMHMPPDVLFFDSQILYFSTMADVMV